MDTLEQIIILVSYISNFKYLVIDIQENLDLRILTVNYDKSLEFVLYYAYYNMLCRYSLNF